MVYGLQSSSPDSHQHTFQLQGDLLQQILLHEWKDYKNMNTVVPDLFEIVDAFCKQGVEMPALCLWRALKCFGTDTVSKANIAQAKAWLDKISTSTSGDNDTTYIKAAKDFKEVFVVIDHLAFFVRRVNTLIVMFILHQNNPVLSYANAVLRCEKN